MQQITFAPTFSAWQKAARQALSEGSRPETIHWQELDDDEPPLLLFEENDAAPSRPAQTFRVPKAFFEMAQKVACHREPQRWALLYRVLWRLTHGEPKLLEILVDPDVHELLRMEKAVRHDVHKMRAFVRFRETSHQGQKWYVAWFEPEQQIVEANARFFVERFTSMQWSILTPDRCAHWDGRHLSFTAGVSRTEAPTEDNVEDLWINYYSHIFNPARVKTHAMEAEMPKKYWKNLPEAAVIPALLNQAPVRVDAMIAQSQSRAKIAADWHPAEVPPTRDLQKLREAAASCQACPLYRDATQTIFGEGPRGARLVLVGEQPGDQEDLGGHPFIGPAGKLLDRALLEAGIDRQAAYLTNAVKHFKWKPRGEWRLHQTPDGDNIAACRPWLAAELASLEPEVLVCLGGTAAQSVFARKVKVLSERGEVLASPLCRKTIITVHPSSLLRTPDAAAREAGFAQFAADLRLAAAAL